MENKLDNGNFYFYFVGKTENFDENYTYSLSNQLHDVVQCTDICLLKTNGNQFK